MKDNSDDKSRDLRDIMKRLEKEFLKKYIL